jgi:hypothetical protein
VPVPIAPIITVFIVIVLSMLVGRVATIALTLTGMSREAARFQARSAMTGAGYTTAESEAVVNHPLRRRIVMKLMLIGSAGIVTVIASVMLTFVRAGAGDGANSTLTLLALVAGTLGLLLLMRLRPVDRAVSRVIRLVLRRFTDLDVRDYAAILEIHGGFAVSELQVDGRDWVADHTLGELELNREGVLVLGVQRQDGSYDGAPGGATRIQPGDVLVIYGHSDQIAALDVRERGWSGDVDHLRATREHRAGHEHRADGPEAPPHPGT